MGVPVLEMAQPSPRHSPQAEFYGTSHTGQKHQDELLNKYAGEIGYAFQCGTSKASARHLPFHPLHQHWQEAHRARANFENAPPRRLPLSPQEHENRVDAEFNKMLADVEIGLQHKRDADIKALVFERTLPWVHNDVQYLQQAQLPHMGWIGPKANWDATVELSGSNPLPPYTPYTSMYGTHEHRGVVS